MGENGVVLEASSVSKSFGATQALQAVDFELRAGEIHALLGENGAGKSTLVKILSGIEPWDEGEVRVAGEAVSGYGPAMAMELGLFVVHQELSLVEELSVAENISLNQLPIRFKGLARGLQVIDRARIRKRAVESLHIMDFHADVDTKVASLDQAGRQVVEICRALAGSARILLLDEPTSSLTPDDRNRLYRRIEAIASRGVAIVLITHNIDEALSVADRVTVLRDGRRVGTVQRGDARADSIIEMMTGLAPSEVFPYRQTGEPRAVRLKVDDLHASPRVNGASFHVHEGEIVGLAGLVGSGRTELMKALFGMLPRHGGSVELDGRSIEPRDPVHAMQSGIFMISEDRQGEGIIPTESILVNMAVSNIVSRGDDDGTAPRGILNWGRIRELCADLKDRILIKAETLDHSILSLSGGNQQKVIIGRCLLNRPRIILADEPTRGVSIGSKVEIYKILRELSETGVSIVIASSEFDELVGLCNRIYIMNHGKLISVVENHNLSSEKLLNYVLSSSSTRNLMH